MVKNIGKKIRKYLFLISVFVFFVSLFSLCYYYIYSDSEKNPIKGGTVSEGIVGDFPSLNPLIAGTDTNKHILGFLYRSLLKYDYIEDKIVGDLATCDLSNLSDIDCVLGSNIYWSNGDPLTVEDIKATYEILKTTNVNPSMKSLLANVTIETGDNSTIIFKNPNNKVDGLNIFFQYIMKKDVLDSISLDDLSKSFANIDSVYSGKFMLDSSSIRRDDKDFFEIILKKNDNYHNNDTFIDNYVIKVFNDSSELKSNIDTINIFNDDKNIIGASVARLSSHYYVTPKYTALFLNEETIKSVKLRNYIFSKINKEQLINLLGKKTFKAIANPYMTDYEIDKEAENTNIDGMMEYMGYFKKSQLYEILGEKTDNGNSKDNSSKSEDDSSDSDNSSSSIETEINKDLIYIDSGLSKKYSFVTEDDILLKGNFQGHEPDAIYFNDYKLKGYSKGDSEFYYRLKEGNGYDSIEEGKNEYKIYFEENGKKEQKEDFIVFFYKDKDELEKAKTSLYDSFVEKEEKIEEEQKIEEISSGAVVKSELQIKIDSLDEKYYYNKDLEKYSLKLMYIDGDQDILTTVNYITGALGNEGFGITPIPINMADLSNYLSNEENATTGFDMFLIGINLGYFDYNIYSYFHSSQAKIGYNFSNIKSLELDVILEDINTNRVSSDELEAEQTKVLDILKKEQVVMTLYTPLRNLLIDKNIKNINFTETSTGNINRESYVSGIYINSESVIQSGKGISGFFKYLVKIITG